MDLASLLTTRVAINELKSQDDRGAFQEVVEALAAAGIIRPGDRDPIREAFLERERRGPTSLGFGMAVPHVFHAAVAAAHLVVARSPAGVEMRAIDGKPVKLLFCIIACEDARPQFLHMLGTVAKVARDKDWRRHMERAGAASQIFEALVQGEKALSK
jgi:mannitol/fructose-specific phosphotransferase system IIA component (Ntr-type)